MNWNVLKDLLKPGTSCVITTHYSPDGDAIGSELALAAFVRQIGISPHIINQDPVPRIYEFLDKDKAAGVYSDGIADVDVADATVAATGQLIYDMRRALGGEITPDVARALFVAIATDTGWFRFSNTSVRVFEIIADLTAKGAAPEELYNLVYEQLRRERMDLLGRGLAELRSAANGRIAWMVFTRRMFDETGADDEDVEGIIDLLRTIGGVEIVILFREATDGTIRVSLRSKNDADVSLLAKLFGGGGHVRAAGIRLSGSLEEATSKVVEAAEELVESVGDCAG